MSPGPATFGAGLRDGSNTHKCSHRLRAHRLRPSRQAWSSAGTREQGRTRRERSALHQASAPSAAPAVRSYWCCGGREVAFLRGSVLVALQDARSSADPRHVTPVAQPAWGTGDTGQQAATRNAQWVRCGLDAVARSRSSAAKPATAVPLVVSDGTADGAAVHAATCGASYLTHKRLARGLVPPAPCMRAQVAGAASTWRQVRACAGRRAVRIADVNEPGDADAGSTAGTSSAGGSSGIKAGKRSGARSDSATPKEASGASRTATGARRAVVHTSSAKRASYAPAPSPLPIGTAGTEARGTSAKSAQRSAGRAAKPRKVKGLKSRYAKFEIPMPSVKDLLVDAKERKGESVVDIADVSFSFLQDDPLDEDALDEALSESMGEWRPRWARQKEDMRSLQRINRPY